MVGGGEGGGGPISINGLQSTGLHTHQVKTVAVDSVRLSQIQ